MSTDVTDVQVFLLPLDGIHVLLVEDTDDSREVATLLLEAHGATVTSVTLAREALAVLDVERCDILVSDIGLPFEDGYQLIRTIRARSPEKGGTIPAIALTAFSRDEDRQASLDAGFEAHMGKPVEPDELVTIIKVLTGRC
ncbi:MAG: response regulator [Acidobacteria bacterium]|nr:response regulator [Acidobacteriota bacterium]